MRLEEGDVFFRFGWDGPMEVLKIAGKMMHWGKVGESERHWSLAQSTKEQEVEKVGRMVRTWWGGRRIEWLPPQPNEPKVQA